MMSFHDIILSLSDKFVKFVPISFESIQTVHGFFNIELKTAKNGWSQSPTYSLK